ncbi:MAG: hypothetical protein RIR40_548, partial [Actinomycetota bacterium]
RSEIKVKVTAQELLLPPAISVARAMINAWYGAEAKAELVSKETWRS